MGGLIPLPKIWFHNTVKVHAWTGVQYENEKNETANQPMVYVTESGTVYHRKLGCSYLNLSVQQICGAVVKTMKNNSTLKLGEYAYIFDNSYSSGRNYSTSLAARTKITITYIDKYTKQKCESIYSISRLAK